MYQHGIFKPRVALIACNEDPCVEAVFTFVAGAQEKDFWAMIDFLKSNEHLYLL